MVAHRKARHFMFFIIHRDFKSFSISSQRKYKVLSVNIFYRKLSNAIWLKAFNALTKPEKKSNFTILLTRCVLSTWLKITLIPTIRTWVECFCNSANKILMRVVGFILSNIFIWDMSNFKKLYHERWKLNFILQRIRVFIAITSFDVKLTSLEENWCFSWGLDGWWSIFEDFCWSQNFSVIIQLHTKTFDRDNQTN